MSTASLSDLSSLTPGDLFGDGRTHSLRFNPPRFADVDDKAFDLLKAALSFPGGRPGVLTDGRVKALLERAINERSHLGSILDQVRRDLEWIEGCHARATALVQTLTNLEERPAVGLPTPPEDILREIFRMSASNGTRQARALSLVSRSVQRWVDSILFSSIRFNDFSYHEEVMTAPKFLTLLQTSPRITRIARKITHITILCQKDENASVEDLYSQLPSLRSLYIGEPSLSLKTWNFKIPGLRRLFWRPANAYVLHIFQTLTHVCLSFDRGVFRFSDFRWKDLNELVQLRVLAVESAIVDISAFQQVHASVSHITTSQLEFILWRLPLSADTTSQWRAYAETVVHPKLVVLVPRCKLLLNDCVWPFIQVKDTRFWDLCNSPELEDLARENLRARGTYYDSIPFLTS
ncbi:hypothetical protein DL96DRAFT_1576939 [Flagelloscypha sp. PMI_526]|nr:hypothetical protein DL96DRAFT_1576939 [Flagelloscypha sp. PMI_526]